VVDVCRLHGPQQGLLKGHLPVT